ncbi:MAG: hypothetical protein P8M04_10650, partial [Akkermansiaceae bacterium]|nr:hypothetical protein [Akkermansiaceae bacterium]
MQKRNTHLTHRTMFALAALVIAPLSVETGYGQEDLLQQEMIRRQQDVAKADELLNEGREAYANKEFETAVQKYREALNTLPYGTATSDRREFITKSLEEGSVALTQQYRQQGKYQEARDLLEEIDKNNPGNPASKKGLEYLDDPTRTEPALTFEHTENVELVRRSLYKGESFYNLGLYDKAEEEFKQVLRTDPYNKAARRWLERCSSVKSDYYRAAYDQTRAEMLMQVDRAWELAVPPLGDQIRQGPDIDSGQDRERSIIAKLNQIIIPDVKLNNITVEEAVEFLRLRSIELDNTVIDESQKGINFVVRTPKTLGEDGGAAGDDEALGGGDGFGDATDPNAILIKNLELRQVPLRVALQYICDEAKLRYKVDEFAVTLLPITEGEDADIVQRRWTVPPTFETFITTSGGGDGGGAGGDPDPFAASDDNGPAGIEPRKDIVTLLKENGVSFPPNSSASFLKSSSTLIVRNTPTNLELIDGIVQAAI